MTTRILAKTASFTDDGYSTLLGFADDPSNPSNYVILSMTNKPDEQDLILNQGGIHIDVGTLHIDGYDLIEDIRETNSGIILSLMPNTAEESWTKQDIEIEFCHKIINGFPVSEVVKNFKDRL